MRRALIVRGRVQGVGFRPWVWRQATLLSLRGTVKNASGEVHIEVYGEPEAIDGLLDALRRDTPPLARVESVEVLTLPDDGLRPAAFAIVDSEVQTRIDAHVPPESAPCAECLAELEDPADRRFGYPFTQCTACGPRYTLIESLPYDRARTSMAGFVLCGPCHTEYTDPSSRRFHAEPIACPDCGPRLLLDGDDGTDPIEAAVARLKVGDVIAVRGVGGYHLLCDAGSEAAVARLRVRKHRPTRPLALLVPSPTEDPLRGARALVEVNDATATALLSPARPIVLAPRRAGAPVAAPVAPGIRDLGIMLPASGLHHLLAQAFGGPLVATSGNRSGEPLATTPQEARTQLSESAVAMLHHDRPIVRPIDDAVVRLVAGAPRLLRAGRGFAPLERRLRVPVPHPMLAVGGHLKSAIALAWEDRVAISPHIGDLEHSRTRAHFARTIETMGALYGLEPREVLCDAHPDYASTRWAQAWAAAAPGRRLTEIGHHSAHASSLVGEFPELRGPWLVFTWDGVGLGPDGTLWGGEALYGRPGRWSRIARLAPLRLLGASRAGREPWRSAAAMCWAARVPFEAPVGDGELARDAWQAELGTVLTSAIGRLFDGAAHLILGITHYGHEAQGPMELEALAESVPPAAPVHLPLQPNGDVVEIDWRPLLPVLTEQTDPAVRASALHDALVDAALRIVHAIEPGQVGVTGGVFTNRVLTERLQSRLASGGRTLRMHHSIPAGDGGLAFGQLIERAAPS